MLLLKDILDIFTFRTILESELKLYQTMQRWNRKQKELRENTTTSDETYLRYDVIE